jgi:diadenosine tetraphosphatase ApaH/serine/threonine PP2A family protein phosphatase
MTCPHCGALHDRVCRQPDGSIDRTPWTRAERDQWREQARREDPSIQFAPSSAQMQERFGERNRRDREAQ